MREFKKGDKVKIKLGEGFIDGTVVGVTPAFYPIIVTYGEDGRVFSFTKEGKDMYGDKEISLFHADEANETKEEPMQKFKVGDKVRLARLTTEEGLNAIPKVHWDKHMGKVVTIDEVEYSDWASIRFSEDTMHFYWPAHCFELVEEKTKELKKETKEKQMTKLTITKDNIWDIVDDKWNYVIASEKGNIILTESKPELTEKNGWKLNNLTTQNLSGIKVTPWWTDHKDSLLCRNAKADTDTVCGFKVGDRVKLVRKHPEFHCFGIMHEDWKKHMGKTFTVSQSFCISPNISCIKLENDDINYSWPAECFELMKEEQPKFKVGDKVKFVRPFSDGLFGLVKSDWEEIAKKVRTVSKAFTGQYRNKDIECVEFENCIGLWVAYSWPAECFELVEEDKLTDLVKLFFDAWEKEQQEKQKPVTPDTKVWTDKGWKPVSEILSAKPQEQKPKTYLEGHKASGLKVGDVVRVTRKAEDYENGWEGKWRLDYDRFLGASFKIRGDWGVYGFDISTSVMQSFYFPYFVLERVY